MNLSSAATWADDAPLPVEAIEGPLPFYDPELRQMRDPKESDTFAPMRVLLSRSRYWADDGHLDVVVRLNTDTLKQDVEDTVMSVTIADTANEVVSSFDITPPHANFIFYPPIPDAIVSRGTGRIELTLKGSDGNVIDQASDTFRVERFQASHAMPMHGVVPIRVDNEVQAVGQAIPMSVGVPFPRGVLRDEARVRLVVTDEAEQREIPIQVSELVRWSKLGSLKWLRLDFTIDLDGTARSLALEYGPSIERKQMPMISIDGHDGAIIPRIDLGRTRVDDGLWHDVVGDGSLSRVLRAEALTGAFVEHADGRIFRAMGDAPFDVEATGPIKVVLRREGWYVAQSGEDRFCKYVTRYVLYKNSPLVRIFHTWIFTGDGNEDGIANMGWAFPLASDLTFQGFPQSFDINSDLLTGQSLLQWDYDHFDVIDDERVREFAEARAPGFALFRGERMAFGFGTRDFWQNYPSELEVRDGTLWFHNWPRHNREAGYTFEGTLAEEPGAPAKPSASRHREYEPGRLSRSEWTLNLLQARFAHEGEVLRFRLPDEAAEDPIVARMRSGRPWNKYWRKGEPESINAQGISRTEEMWLALAPAGDTTTVQRLLQGLNEQTLRAVVDPAWLAASDAFYEIHPQDWENYPQEEHAFEQLALAPGRWQEHLGLYGMWIFGDITGWYLGLDRREPALYRAFRKRHHGWPYSWIPYVRSGDPRLLRLADAATRQNIDANWRHYATGNRRTGLIHRSTLPWASTFGETEDATRTRDYESKTEYLLHAWYVNDYHRAWDLFEDWIALTKQEQPGTLRGPIDIRGPWGTPGDTRFPMTMLKSYIETYEATFDPWFLVAAHELARGFNREFEEDETFIGTPYVTALREYHRFTGSEHWVDHYLRYADAAGRQSWRTYVDPLIEPNVYAWQLTRDPVYLGRVKHLLQATTAAVWLGDEPEYYKGFYLRGGDDHTAPRTTGWLLQYFPLALRALHDAELQPTAVVDDIELHAPIAQTSSRLIFRKQANRAVHLSLRNRLQPRDGNSESHYTVIGPDGSTFATGKWKPDEEAGLTIPADALNGEYTLNVAGASSVVVPVTDSPEVPEVMVLAAGQTIDLRGYHTQMWFYVPEELEQFELDVSLEGGASVRRVSVWSPDGQLAWDSNYQRDHYDGDASIKATVDVPREQAGQLWRITLHAHGEAGFKLDARIPPVYATSRSRWFMPERVWRDVEKPSD